MEGYISIREAAKKWGVSERRINQYCSEGRIPGAEQFGGSWAIPAGAEKPGDPRRQNKQSGSPKPKKASERFPDVMPLMNTPFAPGTCVQTIGKMKAGPKKDIAWAEYHYFSGQAEKAMQEAEGYLTAADGGIRLSACLIFAYSCLTMGRIDHARRALREIQSTLAADGQADPPVRAMEAFVAFAAAVLLHLPVPEELPPAAEFVPLLPPGMRAFALYVQAHALYLKGEYAHSAGIVEAALAMGASGYPIAAIYLHLVAVMDCMSLKQTDRAQAHLLTAWEIARPDDLIEAFGEHHGLMSGTSETTFSPNLTTTRGMIVTTLYRLEGAPDLSNENLGYPYADVDPSAYYADAVYWARQNGIVSGMSAEQFAPNTAITREQLAAILYRYAQFKGYDVSVGENTNILSYTDFAALDAYAIPAMQWACGAGIITGTSEAALSPDGSATRAQVAAILMRFCENIAK